MKNEELLLTNMESIIKVFENSDITTVSNFDKFDGITIECTLKGRSTFNKAKEQLTEVCTNLQLLPLNFEQRKDDNKKFIIQFPELNVVYTKLQIEALYKSNFKFLFNNAILTNPTIKITKELLYKSKDIYVRQCIQAYVRSNINPYKENPQDYLDNIEYRREIDILFYTALDEFCDSKNII